MLNQKSQKNIKKFLQMARQVPFLEQGRDFVGWDCWGLIQRFFQDCLGITLPLASDYSHREAEAALAAFQAEAARYLEILPGQERPWDVLFFRPCHAGLVLRRGWMLNAREGRGTRVERYDNQLWRAQLLGIYRYEPISLTIA